MRTGAPGLRPRSRSRSRVRGRAAARNGRERSFDQPVKETPAIVEADPGSDAAENDRGNEANEVAEPPAQPAAEQGAEETKPPLHRRSLIPGRFSRVFDTDVGNWRLVWPDPDDSARPAPPPAVGRRVCNSCAKYLTLRVMSVLNGRAKELTGPPRYSGRNQTPKLHGLAPRLQLTIAGPRRLWGAH